VLKAVDMTKKALASASYPWKPELRHVLMSLNHFTDRKETRSMLQELVSLTRDVYHCLLETYVHAGKPVTELLDHMKKDSLDSRLVKKQT
jgi:uncharacterized membrane protein required for colicin V production